MAVSVMAGHPALKELSGDLKRRMDQAVASLQSTLASTRTGRASVHMLDQVKVDYYGTPTPISQLGQVSTPEPQLILISPWDPTVLKDIEKAITVADLGFNPQSDGKVVRIPVPPMTEERSRVLEEQRTAVRNVRRDGNDALKKLAKDKKISEDEEKRSQEEVQKMTDEEIRRMEELTRKKEAEVMQI